MQFYDRRHSNKTPHIILTQHRYEKKRRKKYIGATWKFDKIDKNPG